MVNIEINKIDFLSEIKAVIDLNKMIIRVGGEEDEKC